MFKILAAYKNLFVTLSDKKDGSMKAKDVLFGDEKTIKNRQKYFKKLYIKENQVVSAGLIHGKNVRIVTLKDGGKIVPNTDGLVTKDKNLFLTVTVADCLPIFIYDPKNKFISLVHAGWKGLSLNISKVAIQKMQKKFGSKPNDILVGIGPSIGVCHYEVKDDVLSHFKNFPKNVFEKREGKTFLDLKKIAKIQLIKQGLKGKNIEISPECTYCLADKYFSFRRHKPKKVEAMIAVFGMR